MRLIDADVLIKHLREIMTTANHFGNIERVSDIGACIGVVKGERIFNIKRPHGEWIDESKDALKCSACGKWVYKPFIGGFPTERTQHYNPNYCAFCGADMRKEGGDS